MDKSFALAVSIHCNNCEKDMKKWLEKIPGVDSVSLDAAQGKVTISGTVDPQFVIKTLGKHKRKAKLLWEKSLPTNKADDMQIVIQKKPPVGMRDQNMVMQLQQLSQIEGLENVEVTYTKRVKLTFKGQEGEPSKKIVVDDVYRPKMHHERNNVHDCHGYHGIDSTCCGHCRVCGMHNQGGYGYWQPPVCPCIPLPMPPPPWPTSIPSAPELVSDYDRAGTPPPPAYSYPSTYGDDYQNGCKMS
ncbi:hypothetical protein RJ640_001354 [Escallonia rubra]|uniref:HMA domain-containing protein n=1 Tax=Escallonia rubra TaxID=112253 RepID=A0AA88UCN6_9ASTE|nr:hypothetical protein RJ640_001354 [Escallonia rubra]